MVMRISRVPYLALLAVGLIAGCEGEQERADQPFPPELVDEAERTLKLAATYFHDEVSVEGSYVWRVSPDGAFRSGEGKTDDRQGWVQAPGTPAVGSAYIAAYEATDDPYYWEHLIVTFSHALDLELCHGLLGHGFAFAGLIGSATKWARAGRIGIAMPRCSTMTSPRALSAS